MSGEVLGTVSYADPDVLKVEIAEQLRLIREDREFREDVERLVKDLVKDPDFTMDDLDNLLNEPEIYEVKPPKNHFSGVAEGILIKIAVNVGTTISVAIATLIWKQVIKPAIRKGSRTIKDES